jgi:hypothetical protein
MREVVSMGKVEVMLMDRDLGHHVSKPLRHNLI